MPFSITTVAIAIATEDSIAVTATEVNLFIVGQ